MIRPLLQLFLALMALPALAQTPSSPTAPQAAAPAPTPAMVNIAVQTSLGRIVIALEKERAPVTTANFLRYVDGKRLDGTTFYRTVKVGEGFGFVQFGVQNAPARVLPPIAHEPTTKTGVRHLNGAISIARLDPGSARGDFTISVGDQPSLDADPSRAGDNLGYAAFGHVIEGMEVVHQILDQPVSAAGEGVFKGQMIASPVKILSVRRVP